MKITGSGSRLSPIAIDDSEDEVLQELVGEASFESNSSPSTTDQRDKVPRNGVLTKGYHRKPSFEGKTSQKRKRGMNDAQSGLNASTSQQRLDSATHTQPETLSKKAKKRRRKLERLLQEHGGQPPRPPVLLTGAHHLASELPDSNILGMVGVGLDKSQSVYGPYSTYNTSTYIPQQYNAEMPVASSSSSWVTSMAMAAEAPISDANGIENRDSYSYSTTWHDHSQYSSPNIQQFSAPIPAPEPPPAPPPAPLPAVPKAPSPAQIIGMKPDHDPSSKHGLFVIPPNATRGNADATSTKREPYIPNPARTLVMEQLPKSHRSQDWVNKWSKSACGAYPVFLSIDNHGAKALVEFSTAELARKAWGSPRLGKALVGLKGHLKGRPREDLIKVWWYRVDGIGANAGVGEIEEGEIEGDVAEKEIEVPLKKETKKERKARLARERQAKQLAAAAKLPAPPQKTLQTNVAIPGAPAPKEAVKPQPFALPSNPVNYSQLEPNTGYPYYPIIPQPLPHPLPQHPSAHNLPVSLRAPLPPQFTLETQWRPQHELPKKPTQETILNATPPILSSTSLSLTTEALTTTAQPITPPLKSPVPPTYEDMDVDDDMDLESPNTAKRATFDLPPAPPMQTQVQAVVLQPLPSTPQVVPVAVLNPLMTSESPISDVGVPSNTLDSVLDTSVPLSNHESTPNTRAPPPAVTFQSRSASITFPEEPRAMKNAPKGPSFKIRSLAARQKELEERIARSKMELGLTTTLVPSATSIASPVTTESLSPEDGEGKQAMEERLRSLVLRSQKNRSKSLASTTSSTDVQVPSPISALASPSPSNVVASAAGVLPKAPATAPAPTFSLDDLAVSFITETIETFKATPNPPPPVPAPATVSITAQNQDFKVSTVAKQKLELAAQQKRLEAQIAETKILMAKFEKAQTKQERETILAALREQSRAASTSKDDDDLPTTLTVAASATTTKVSKPRVQLFTNNAGITIPGNTTAHAVKKWLGSHEHDAGVLIVSDDEDEESDGDY